MYEYNTKTSSYMCFSRDFWPQDGREADKPKRPQVKYKEFAEQMNSTVSKNVISAHYDQFYNALIMLANNSTGRSMSHPCEWYKIYGSFYLEYNSKKLSFLDANRLKFKILLVHVSTCK